MESAYRTAFESTPRISRQDAALIPAQTQQIRSVIGCGEARTNQLSMTHHMSAKCALV